MIVADWFLDPNFHYFEVFLACFGELIGADPWESKAGFRDGH
jgi:hypothetical protein